MRLRAFESAGQYSQYNKERCSPTRVNAHDQRPRSLLGRPATPFLFRRRPFFDLAQASTNLPCALQVDSPECGGMHRRQDWGVVHTAVLHDQRQHDHHMQGRQRQAGIRHSARVPLSPSAPLCSGHHALVGATVPVVQCLHIRSIVVCARLLPRALFN